MRYLCSGCGCKVVLHHDITPCPGCGGVLVDYVPTYAAGLAKAKICRSNSCGNYNAESDTCMEVIRIGVLAGKSRPGKISYLYTHPNTKCPVDLF